jgi:tartrate-resistant acid phosphatase type 5
MRILLTIAAAAVLSGGCGDTKPGRNRTQQPPAGESLPPRVKQNVPSTPAPTGGTMRFAVVGDTGNGNANEYLVAEQIKRKCEASGCDFVILLGDNVYPEGVSSVDDPQWETKVRAPYLSMGYRVRAILGGHDYGTIFPDLRGAEAQMAYSAKEPLWEMPARFHSAAEGPALLLFFDTSPMAHTTEGYPAVQAGYFHPVIDSTTKPWRLAFGHDPYLSNGSEHGNATGDRAVFLSDVLCSGVDAYFAGHDHHREVFAPPPGCPVTQVISGAGSMAFPVVETQPSLFKSPTLGFTYVTVDPHTLTIDMVDAAGTTDYSLTLRK